MKRNCTGFANRRAAGAADARSVPGSASQAQRQIGLDLPLLAKGSLAQLTCRDGHCTAQTGGVTACVRASSSDAPAPVRRHAHARCPPHE
eukprot:2645770-Rhodomonas_salina.1